MAEVAIGALRWQRAASNSPDLVAPYLCDFTAATSYRFTPKGVLPATPSTVNGAEGIVVDNMLNGVALQLQCGPIIEVCPAFQKTYVRLDAQTALDVTITGASGTSRVYFFTGAFHGNTQNVNTYAAYKAGVVTTNSDGSQDVYFNTIRWKINSNIAECYNLDNLLDSGFFDVLNPTTTNNQGAQLPAGTWAIQSITYSSSNLYQRQIACNLLDATQNVYERQNIQGVWTQWAPRFTRFAPFVPLNGQTTAYALGDCGRDLFGTGTFGVTIPDGGIGWRSGEIRNDNSVSGLGTISVPAGATLDGVQDATVILFPYQVARVVQIAAKAYRTQWVQRVPMIRSYKAGASLASWDFVLPDGYQNFRFTISDVFPNANNGQLIAWFSFDNGQSYANGANTYNFDYLLSQGTNILGSNGTTSAMIITGGLLSSFPGIKPAVDFQINPGSLSTRPSYRALSGYTDGGQNICSLLYTGSIGQSQRPNAMRITWGTATQGTAGITQYGE